MVGARQFSSSSFEEQLAGKSDGSISTSNGIAVVQHSVKTICTPIRIHLAQVMDVTPQT